MDEELSKLQRAMAAVAAGSDPAIDARLAAALDGQGQFILGFLLGQMVQRVGAVEADAVCCALIAQLHARMAQ
jgi:hypothetical protein